MRVTQDWNERHLCLGFVEDAKDGGCIVECPHCGFNFNTLNYNEKCPDCLEEMVYPGWCEW